jgi:hypothetical protein
MEIDMSAITSCDNHRTNLPFAEPSIAQILSDPIVKAVMSADRVDPKALGVELRRIARNLTVLG